MKQIKVAGNMVHKCKQLSIDLLILAIVQFINVPTAERILPFSTFQSDSQPLCMCDIVEISYITYTSSATVCIQLNNKNCTKTMM